MKRKFSANAFTVANGSAISGRKGKRVTVRLNALNAMIKRVGKSHELFGVVGRLLAKTELTTEVMEKLWNNRKLKDEECILAVYMLGMMVALKNINDMGLEEGDADYIE